MLGKMAHVGITVRNMEKALGFYRDTLGMQVLGDVVTIAGEEADSLTQLAGTSLQIAYLRGKDDVKSPPLELLHFVEPRGEEGKPYARLTNPGITEVAFWVKDIEKSYEELRTKGVSFYSRPQLFALEGYGKVKAVYFCDPDGTTLELIQTVKE